MVFQIAFTDPGGTQGDNCNDLLWLSRLPLSAFRASQISFFRNRFCLRLSFFDVQMIPERRMNIEVRIGQRIDRGIVIVVVELGPAPLPDTRPSLTLYSDEAY
jgi:hypothetical protein